MAFSKEISCARRVYPGCGVIVVLLGMTLGVGAQNLTRDVDTPYVETIAIAKSEGILMELLDSTYKSALHADSSKAVFKPGKEQDDFIEAYTNFLQDLGNYLKKNNFMWGQPTRCWNRIYFRSDGAVDYYLFSFKTEISSEKLLKFKELLRAYLTGHKINATASTGFAQCSPVVYMDK